MALGDIPDRQALLRTGSRLPVHTSRKLLQRVVQGGRVAGPVPVILGFAGTGDVLYPFALFLDILFLASTFLRTCSLSVSTLMASD